MTPFKLIVRSLCVPLLYGIQLFPETSMATDACNTDNILAVINRPTIAVSPCVVSADHLLTEGGFEHLDLVAGSYANVYPDTQIRFGLGHATEVYAYTPVYVENHASPYAGNTTFAVGGKHVFLNKDPFVLTLDAVVYPSGGSVYYGFQTTSAQINGIANYSMDPWSISLILSIMSLSQPYNLPNQTAAAFGPDLVVSYTINPKMYVYGEIYGQTKVSPNTGSGFNFDGGLAYLVRNNITVDIEASSRITGLLGQFSTYIGFGGTIQL